jgi:hypothetical protein
MSRAPVGDHGLHPGRDQGRILFQSQECVEIISWLPSRGIGHPTSTLAPARLLSSYCGLTPAGTRYII